MTDQEIKTLAGEAVDAWGGCKGDAAQNFDAKRDSLISWIFVMFRPYLITKPTQD